MGRSWTSLFYTSLSGVSKCPGSPSKTALPGPRQATRLENSRGQSARWQAAGRRGRQTSTGHREFAYVAGRVVNQGGFGRDQVADKAFSLSEVVASPRTGRRLNTRVSYWRGTSCKAGAESARNVRRPRAWHPWWLAWVPGERGKTGLILMIWVVFDIGRSVGDLHAEEEDDPPHRGMTNLCDGTIEGKPVLVRVSTA